MKKALIVIGIVVVLLALGAAKLYRQMPQKGPPLIDLGGGIQGVLCRFSYAWIVPSDTGVVLIDAGLDETAADIRAALQRRGLGPEAVRAILITHGHGDHFGGAAAFPDAPAFAHRADIPLIRGEVKRPGFIGAIFGKISSRKKPPARLAPLPEGAEIAVDGITFRIIGLPGHSPGSVAYLLGDVLFSGDALMGRGDSVMPPTSFTSSDPDQAMASLEKLRTVPFRIIANGHTGAVFEGHAKLEAYLRNR
ncbi:MAG: MBL fold metallo-hydrolase [Deltaproteobacteria bacterium]|nr:MBL fold metallo-hydrolase [Deltaproteobacteria bacterium]